MQGKRRLSPSKSAWMNGDLVVTKYEKSCARFVLWERRFEKEANIDPIYEAMGTLDETRYATKLKREKIKFEREVEISHQIGDTGIPIEGRIDFELFTPQGPVLVEKKSTISPRREYDIIQKGNIDPGHLAQLVSYMAVKKIPDGKVVVTFWKWDDTIDGLVVGSEREFLVKVTPQGDITVDGIPSAYHVRHLQQWYYSVARAMNKADSGLPPRPKITPYQNPCKYCPLANSCNKYDSDRNINAFWEDTKNIEMSAGKPAEIVEPKKEKKGKKDGNQLQASNDTNHDGGRISDKTGLFRREVDQ